MLNLELLHAISGGGFSAPRFALGGLIDAISNIMPRFADGGLVSVAIPNVGIRIVVPFAGRLPVGRVPEERAITAMRPDMVDDRRRGCLADRPAALPCRPPGSPGSRGDAPGIVTTGTRAGARRRLPLSRPHQGGFSLFNFDFLRAIAHGGSRRHAWRDLTPPAPANGVRWKSLIRKAELLAKVDRHARCVVPWRQSTTREHRQPGGR
jgi:hypothetical protein